MDPGHGEPEGRALPRTRGPGNDGWRLMLVEPSGSAATGGVVAIRDSPSCGSCTTSPCDGASVQRWIERRPLA